MDALVFTVVAVVLAGGAAALFAALWGKRTSRAAEALDHGDFAAAAELEATDRDSLYSTAVAAKHLLEFDRAAELLERILAADPRDGEARLERGLVAAYVGDRAAAERSFAAALGSRADLSESLTLHRAWCAAESGDERAARRLFEEIEVALENKLVADLGGDPLFAEWFWHASILWRLAGRDERARWAWQQGLEAAPTSRLPERLDAGRPA